MLFRKKIERSCGYCRFGVELDAGQILCAKKGTQSIHSPCRKFRYEPCKRIPPKPKALDFSKYEQEDFSL